MKKLLFIGWESADWTLLHPLLDAGKLPNLQGLIEQGVIGRMTGIQPASLAAGWTSMATGKYPCKHGIINDFEPIPDNSGIRPATRLGCQVSSLWNILEQQGMHCQQIGWPASHPADPLAGVVVSDWFTKPFAASAERWPLLEGTLYPPDLTADLAQLRMHPGELRVEELRAFIPELDQLNIKHPLVGKLMLAIAQSSSIQAAATELLATRPWDVAAIHFGAIGDISRDFLNFHPPQLKFVNNTDYQLFHKVLESSYILHDMMLGVLLQQTDKQTTVAVVSERGFHLDDRRRLDPDVSSTSPDSYQVGTLVLSGPGIKHDTLIYGASVLDITPTMLHHLGLAIGCDMDGQVLQQVFDTPSQPDWVDSWDEQTHPSPAETEASPEPTTDDPELAAALQKLEADRDYGLAESYREAQQEGEAIRILDRLWQDDPAEIRYPQRLIECYLKLQRTDLARTTLEQLLEKKKQYAPEARRAWQLLDARDPAELTSTEQVEKARLWKRSRTNLAAMSLMQAKLLYSEGKTEQALALALSIDETKVIDPMNLITLRAQSLFDLDRFTESEQQFEQLKQVQPGSPDPYLGLSRIRYQQKRFKAAAELASTSIGLRYYNPDAHHLYAASVYQTGHPKRAADALKIAIAQDPYSLGAYQRLELLYDGPLKDDAQAAIYCARAKQVSAAAENLISQHSRGIELPEHNTLTEN